jgi:mRNA-degrading endonuclease toxin of MazEF toxin-antitoxin module
MTVPIRRGAIYWVEDAAIDLPPTETSQRVVHPRRPFLVVTTDDSNADVTWPIVLGYPVSTAERFMTEHDVPLPTGTANLSKRSHVQVALLQPVSKSKLLEWIGQVDANTLELVNARALSYIGLI